MAVCSQIRLRGLSGSPRAAATTEAFTRGRQAAGLRAMVAVALALLLARSAGLAGAQAPAPQSAMRASARAVPASAAAAAVPLDKAAPASAAAAVAPAPGRAGPAALAAPAAQGPPPPAAAAPLAAAATGRLAAAPGAAGAPPAAPVGTPALASRPQAAPPALAAAGGDQASERSWLAANYPQTYHMWQLVTAASIVKVLCMVGNIMTQVSPYPQVKRWAKYGCTGEVDAAPYVSIAFGGWQWCFYGTFAWLLTGRSGFLVLVHSNSLGALLGTYYTMTFYCNCRNERALNTLHVYFLAIAGLVFLQVCGMVSLAPVRALFLSGMVASVCSFIGALSMLVSVPSVIAAKDSSHIPGPLVIANFCSAIFWCICGWMLEDPLITGPNVASCLSSGLCLWLKYCMFPAAEACDGDGEEMPLASAGKENLMEPSCGTFATKEMMSFGAKAAEAELACAGPADAWAPGAAPGAEALRAGGTGGTS
ncbi:unnamed protein product [Prorocentrum cordatum]|uniref:Sugar transporter SWEET1 n=1 Tax=Prorocentrum cordatum TaxID=2364126 RepID=A0ABN9QNZ1_9DINO|nr:unnamed protein product [Polarella glacialis]